MSGFQSSTAATPSTDTEDHAAGLLLEWLAPDTALGLKNATLVESIQSPYQRIDVYDTPQFGRAYRLDGRFMASEADEYFYHECIVHPAALGLPALRSALIVGGGDGGSAREILKYPGVERVVVAELDAQVIEVTRRHLPGIACGAFDDPRLRICVGDGRDYVAKANARGEQFDMVVFDLTEADGSASALHAPAFFEQIKQLLGPHGVLCLHLGAPLLQAELVRRLLRDLGACFKHVRPGTLYIPLYGTLWAFACASDTYDPATVSCATIDGRLHQFGMTGLRYYNAQLHPALFALPTALRRSLLP